MFLRIFIVFLGCFFISDCSLYSQPQIKPVKAISNIELEVLKQASFVGNLDFPKFETIEDQMEYGLLRFQKSYPDPIFQNLLRQKNKFRALATACIDSKHPTGKLLHVRGELIPIKVTKDIYLLELKCGLYRVMSTFTLFPYSISKGIQTKPFKFVRFEEDKRGKFMKKEEVIILGSPSYDQNTKELIIETICDISGGHHSSLATYKLEGNKLILKKFLLGGDPNKRCVSNPKQLYP